MIKKYKYTDTKQGFDFTGKKIIIWGTSFAALELYIELANKADVIGFTDSFSKTEGTFAGLPLYSHSEVEKMSDKDTWVYIATRILKYRIEIMELLEHTNLNILCNGTVYGPYEFNIEESKEHINDNMSKIQFVAQNLCDEKSIKTFKNLLEYRKTNDYRLIENVFEDGHEQYFPIDEIIKHTDKEIFVDAGGYNGDTSVQFSKWVNGKYKKNRIA